MAEVLGIVASATQLLDLSVRVLLASSQLYSKLRNVPDEIETIKRNTQQFIDLIRIVSMDLSVLTGPRHNSLEIAHQVTSLIHDATKESGELARLLEELSGDPSRSARRAWNAVVSAKKEREIANRCQRIESFKSSLQLWHQHYSSARLEQQLSQIKNSQLALQSNFGLLTQQYTTIVDSNQAIASQIASHPGSDIPTPPTDLVIRRRRRTANNFCACFTRKENSIISIYTFQVFFSRERSHFSDCSFGRNSTLWSFGLRALHPRVQVLLGTQLGGGTLSMIGRISPHNIVDPRKSPTFLALEFASKELVGFFGPSAIFVYGLPPYGSEFRACPRKNLKLYVDQCAAPEHVQQQAVSSIFENLLQRLSQAFESGTASPADQTPEGVTALHAFIYLAMGCLRFQSSLYCILDKIIKCLVAGDIDPNEWTTSEAEILHTVLGPIAIRLSGSPFCVMASFLERAVNIPLTMWEHLRLDQILAKHGIGASRYIQDGGVEPSMAEVFIRNPLLLEGQEQLPIYAAVIRRSEKELRRLVSGKKLDFEGEQPSVLSLAVGWPTGLEILLDAGADPDDALKSAIIQQQLLSIEILLDYGSSKSKSGPLLGYLSFALDASSSSGVESLLIQKLVERREELRYLALKTLSNTCLQRHGKFIQPESPHVLDYGAQETFQELISHGIEAPPSLWPGRLTTIYHLPLITYRLAKKLYDAGFRDINQPDGDGFTPILNAIVFMPYLKELVEQPNLIRWYLRNGATLPHAPKLHLILQHRIPLVARISVRIWITQDDKLCGPMETFRQLNESATQHDNCTCWCSTRGCSLVGIILGKKANVWPMDRRRLLLCLPLYSLLGLSLDQQCFKDICRLEIFDRLGMAHTCCGSFYHRFCHVPDIFDSEKRGILENDLAMSLEERQELQEEDQSLKPILDSYVELYANLLQQHSGSFESFWIAWWLALEYYLPFELSEEEKRHCPSIKLAGVEYPETHGQGDGGRNYDVDAEGIRSFVHQYVLILNREAVADFLSQLQPEHVLGASRIKTIK